MKMIKTNYVMGGTKPKQASNNSGVCPCLTAAMVEGAKYIPLIVEIENNESLNNEYWKLNQYKQL